MLFADPARFDDSFFERLLPLLPKEKQTALQAIRPVRSRRESMLGWGLLLFAWKSLHPDLPLPALSFDAGGKPRFFNEPLFFSLSHTDTLVCLALNAAGDVGADVQTLKTPSDSLARRVLTEAEQAVLAAAADQAMCFTRLWTMKEALVKQTGEGLSHAFASLDFASFAALDRFSAFGLEFSVECCSGAVATCCARGLSPEPSQLLEQRQMENVLFSE